MSPATLDIDGKVMAFQPGKTILDVAREAGIHTIPTLCYLKNTTATGSCRMCLVEVEGARTLLPACVTMTAPGMVVRTESARIDAARKMVIELLLASGNHNCLICEANGECELQALAYRYQVPASGITNPPDTGYYYEDNNSMIVRDFSKCIMCGRCVRACNEKQVNQAISIGYRGSHNKIVAKADFPYIDSDCVFCGECVQSCPVGALLDKNASQQGRPWELSQIRTTCPYCGVGCQMDLHLKGGRIVKATGAHAVPNQGRLCIKGRFGLGFVQHEDRLKTPLIKEDGSFREATWDEALDLVALRLTEIKRKYGPEKIGGLASARVTNEENYLMQKMMRAVIGTGHVDHCARLCHASTVAGLAATYGSGSMTNSIGELEYADCILVIGSNPTENHPVIGANIKRAACLKNKDLIVIDPRRQDLVRHARLWLRQYPGTDIAVINGMMHVILAENLHDAAYVAERTENFEAVQKRRPDIPRNMWKRSAAYPPPTSSRQPVSTPRRPQPPSSSAWASPSIPWARTTSRPSPIWPCFAAMWAFPMPGSIPCGDRTTYRAPATWGRCPTSSPPTRRWPTPPTGRRWRKPGGSPASPIMWG